MGWCAVAGTVAGDRQGALKKLEARPGSTLEARLVPEPDNPHDSNAVAVYIRGEQVGYLPRDPQPPQSRPPADLPVCEARLVGGDWQDIPDPDRHLGVRLFW